MCLVFRTPDVELILSDRAFDEDEMAQKRLLMCPGWLVSLLLLYLAPYIKAGRPSAINPILFSRSQANLSDLRILDLSLALKASMDLVMIALLKSKLKLRKLWFKTSFPVITALVFLQVFGVVFLGRIRTTR